VGPLSSFRISTIDPLTGACAGVGPRQHGVHGNRRRGGALEIQPQRGHHTRSRPHLICISTRCERDKLGDQIMKDLRAVLDILADEANAAMPPRTALQSNKDAPPRERLAERIAREPLLRGKIDAACENYARTLTWPALSEAEIIFAHDRLLEGIRFGKWLLKHVPAMPAVPTHEWIRTLLIDSWHHHGVLRWREQIKTMGPFPEWL
jgi:hypothetical protein